MNEYIDCAIAMINFQLICVHFVCELRVKKKINFHKKDIDYNIIFHLCSSRFFFVVLFFGVRKKTKLHGISFVDVEILSVLQKILLSSDKVQRVED